MFSEHFGSLPTDDDVRELASIRHLVENGGFNRVSLNNDGTDLNGTAFKYLMSVIKGARHVKSFISTDPPLAFVTQGTERGLVCLNWQLPHPEGYWWPLDLFRLRGKAQIEEFFQTLVQEVLRKDGVTEEWFNLRAFLCLCEDQNFPSPSTTARMVEAVERQVMNNEKNK
jgi:hypothetical protein